MIPNQQTTLDPSIFKGMAFAGANSTESVPVPAGEWTFTIDGYDIIVWEKKDKSARGLKCVFKLSTTDEQVVAVTSRPKNVLEYEFLLDLTPEGGLDMGKGMNVSLGRARAACGLNDPTAKFMFDQFVGRQVKGIVKHEPYQERLLAKVSGIAAVGEGPAAGTVVASSGYVPGA